LSTSTARLPLDESGIPAQLSNYKAQHLGSACMRCITASCLLTHPVKWQKARPVQIVQLILHSIATVDSWRLLSSHTPLPSSHALRQHGVAAQALAIPGMLVNVETKGGYMDASGKSGQGAATSNRHLDTPLHGAANASTGRLRPQLCR
jgi:hypothetical protein